MPQLKSHLSEKLTMPLLSLKLISMEDVNKNADRLIIAKRKKRRFATRKMRYGELIQNK